MIYTFIIFEKTAILLEIKLNIIGNTFFVFYCFCLSLEMSTSEGRKVVTYTKFTK